jgi:cysteine sulfinate desulfinase/cysteine desulfurase-like protein
MAFDGVHASMLLERLARRDIVAYSYSRFSSGNFERKSLVEIAGLSSVLKHTVVGFALNIYNTKEEIETTIEAVKEEVAKIRLEFSGNICKENK